MHGACKLYVPNPIRMGSKGSACMLGLRDSLLAELSINFTQKNSMVVRQEAQNDHKDDNCWWSPFPGAPISGSAGDVSAIWDSQIWAHPL